MTQDRLRFGSYGMNLRNDSADPSLLDNVKPRTAVDSCETRRKPTDSGWQILLGGHLIKSRQDLAAMGYRDGYRDECTSAPDTAACARSAQSASTQRRLLLAPGLITNATLPQARLETSASKRSCSRTYVAHAKPSLTPGSLHGYG
jgi:hypothetical protein